MVPLWQMSATPRAGRAPTTWSGQQRRAVEEIDEAVAVGAEIGQAAGRALESGGEALARGCAGLGEAGGKADEAAGAAARQSGGDRRDLVVGSGDERRIGRLRKIIDGAKIVALRRRGPARMDAPDRAR